METTVDDSKETLSENEDVPTFTHNEEMDTSARIFFTPDMLRVLAWAGILLIIYFMGVFGRKAQRRHLSGPNNDNDDIDNPVVVFLSFLILFSSVALMSGIYVHWFGNEWVIMDFSDSARFIDDKFHNLMFNCTPGSEPQQQLSLSMLGPAEG